MQPDQRWPIDAEYETLYQEKTAIGRAVAADCDAVIVAIARNAMPMLPNTLRLVSLVQREFRSCRMFVFENDSTDGTDAVLDDFAAFYPWATVQHDTLSRPDVRGFERERTEALAEYRNKCLEWVRENAGKTTFTIVLDMDPDGGFSVDGVFNSIGWLASKTLHPGLSRPGGMASFSLFGIEGDPPRIAHYDAWAARPVSWWRDRRSEIGFGWFSYLLFPAGSPPMPMNSAFGGLAVYYTEAYLSGGYSGEDCEHVPHHKRMRDAGWGMFLNPGARYVAVWRDDDDSAE